MRKISKKGAEMTVGTLVIIVLAIIVLVVVALGFGTGWSNLWGKIKGYFGGGANVDDVKQACSYACTTKAAFDYCCSVRDVKYSATSQEKTTCNIGKSKLGLEACGDVDCSSAENMNLCTSTKCTGTAKVKCDDTENTVSAKTFDADGSVIQKEKVCCEPKAGKKCMSAAKDCADLAADKSECEAQKTIKGIVPGTCKYTAAVGTTAAKCDAESGYAIIQCGVLPLTGTDAQKESQCIAQQGCNWS